MSDNSSSSPRLIFDVGFNNGDDSHYYLSRGFNVLAVEANAELVEEGKTRFASELASGRLTLLHAAVWSTSGDTVTFFINDAEHGQSSLHPERGKRGEKFREATVVTVSIKDLFTTYGVPWYLKIDIEGADETVVRSLPESGEVPKYLSFEVRHGCPAVDLLSPLGYTGFKLINPDTLTQSLPIFDHEFAVRLLRKPSVLMPPVRSLIANLPESIRPKKILWDPPRDRGGYSFSTYTTGPFGEDTSGAWKSGVEMKRWLEYVYSEYTNAGLEDGFWFDLHAMAAIVD